MSDQMKTLKEIRKQKGLTQTQAAEALGIAFRTYQDWEYRPGNFVQAALDAKETLLAVKKEKS
jgi:transcriptional regulator with XRE-family HTH domain